MFRGEASALQVLLVKQTLFSRNSESTSSPVLMCYALDTSPCNLPRAKPTRKTSCRLPEESAATGGTQAPAIASDELSPRLPTAW